MEVPADFSNALIGNPRAEATFELLTGADRYSLLYRIGSAKKAEVRARRIEQFVDVLARGETIHPRAQRPTWARMRMQEGGQPIDPAPESR